MMKVRLSPVARGFGAALLAVTLVAQPALAAYSKYGTSTCSATNRVWIYSKASVEVSHSWKNGGYKQWPPNPYRQYRENNTGYSSTWWVVDYDFEIDYWGAYCAPI
jgi:hypothetical protein